MRSAQEAKGEVHSEHSKKGKGKPERNARSISIRSWVT